MGDLTGPDSLRLNMLLTQPLLAVRIDESKMIVQALTERGEASVELTPDCREQEYLKRVRELLSSHFLGSPGGYPVFLRRWTRMGQAREDNLEKLLLVGEEEAAVAVVHAAGLDPELARRAWWAYPNADNARCMLANKRVAADPLGPILAEYLLEYLSFETSSQAIMESIRLVLQPGLLDGAARRWLWQRAQRRTTYLAGYLLAGSGMLPDDLARDHPERQPFEQWLAGRKSGAADALLVSLSATGQAYLGLIARILQRPADQDVVVAVFESLERWYAPLRRTRASSRDPDQLAAAVAAARREVERELGDCEAYGHLIDAVLCLSNAGEQLIAPVLGRSDAVGSVLRKQLRPVIEPVLLALQALGPTSMPGIAPSSARRRSDERC